jgi:hypothetical protein
VPLILAVDSSLCVVILRRVGTLTLAESVVSRGLLLFSSDRRFIR